MPIRMSRNGKARACNDIGNECQDADDAAGALKAYREAARLAPQWAAPWFNIGLVHKYRHEWAESLHANQQAVDRACMAAEGAALGRCRGGRPGGAGGGGQDGAGEGGGAVHARLHVPLHVRFHARLHPPGFIRHRAPCTVLSVRAAFAVLAAHAPRGGRA